MINFELNSSRPVLCFSKMKLWRSPPQRRGSKIIIDDGVCKAEKMEMMFG